MRGQLLVPGIAQEQIITIDNPKNNYGVVIDPLDGSSLIDVNLCIGSIIGIYPGHVLEKGATMIAALYILYGPLTVMTLTTGKGVHEFVLDDSGEFVLKEQDIRIPEGKLYAPGAPRKDYLPAHARWIEHLEHQGYILRFSGCFVADVHQILHKVGVFTYPGFKGKEKGKLRLLYEANPMGKIISEAGGAVSNTPFVERTGLKAGRFARWMLRGRKRKHWMRTLYDLRSLWQLKGASLDETGTHDYWQAGRSVEGIQSVEGAGSIVRRFAAAAEAQPRGVRT